MNWTDLEANETTEYLVIRSKMNRPAPITIIANEQWGVRFIHNGNVYPTFLSRDEFDWFRTVVKQDDKNNWVLVVPKTYNRTFLITDNELDNLVTYAPSNKPMLNRPENILDVHGNLSLTFGVGVE